MKTKKPKRPPMNLRQIDSSSHEETVTIPLLLLMDDLAHNSFDSSVVESLANCVKGRCYAATVDSDNGENAYIERAREQWAKTLGGAL